MAGESRCRQNGYVARYERHNQEKRRSMCVRDVVSKVVPLRNADKKIRGYKDLQRV